MEDLTTKQIKRKKLELERDIVKLIREFELSTNIGIDKIELNIAYQMGYSHSMVVSVETKFNL